MSDKCQYIFQCGEKNGLARGYQTFGYFFNSNYCSNHELSNLVKKYELISNHDDNEDSDDDDLNDDESGDDSNNNESGDDSNDDYVN